MFDADAAFVEHGSIDGLTVDANQVNGAAIFYVEKRAVDGGNSPVLFPKPTRFFQAVAPRPKGHLHSPGLVFEHQHIQVLAGVEQGINAGFAPDKAGFQGYFVPVHPLKTERIGRLGECEGWEE